jgi:hypothetical protein
MLGPRGHEEQHFGTAIDGQVDAFQQNLANLFPQRRAAGIAARDDRSPPRFKPLAEAGDLRRLAGAIHAIEGEKHRDLTGK